MARIGHRSALPDVGGAQQFLRPIIHKSRVAIQESLDEHLFSTFWIFILFSTFWIGAKELPIFAKRWRADRSGNLPTGWSVLFLVSFERSPSLLFAVQFWIF